MNISPICVTSLCLEHREVSEADFNPLEVGSNLGYLVFSLIFYVKKLAVCLAL